MYYSELSRKSNYSAPFGGHLYRRFIYDGKESYTENPMRLGKHEKNALDFMRSLHGSWSSYNIHDRTTVRAVKGLVRKGYVEINRHGQFRSVGYGPFKKYSNR